MLCGLTRRNSQLKLDKVAAVPGNESTRSLWLNNNNSGEEKMPMILTPSYRDPQPQPLDFSVKQTYNHLHRHYLPSSNSETSEDEGVGPPGK